MELLKKIFVLILGNIKLITIKFFHLNSFKYNIYNNIFLSSEIEIKNKGKISFGRKFICKRNCRISANGGRISIGDNSGINNNCYIVSHEKIKIGNNVDIGPNVVIVDHDHDYKIEFATNKRNCFKTSSVEIGNNVWIGANSVILRGTRIGNNCIIGAGSIINGVFPNDSIIIQTKITKVDTIKKERENK